MHSHKGYFSRKIDQLTMRIDDAQEIRAMELEK